MALVREKLRSIEGFLRVSVLRHRVPLLLSIRLSHECNFRCAYCRSAEIPASEMPTNEVLSCLEEFAHLGARKVGFQGGEPLLRKDIGAIVRRAKDLGYVATMNSNGWLVPERIGEIRHLDILVLSLDGPPEVHDRLRRPGSFERVLDAIRVAERAGIRVWTLTVLTRHNLGHVPFVLDLAERHGLRCIFQPVEQWDFFPEPLDALEPPEDSFRDTIHLLAAEKRRGRPVAPSSSYLDFLALWPRYPAGRACWARMGSALVQADGRVVMCSGSDSTGGEPNGRRVGFARAFKEMAGGPCHGCWTHCYQEGNAIFSWEWPAIKNLLAEV